MTSIYDVLFVVHWSISWSHIIFLDFIEAQTIIMMKILREAFLLVISAVLCVSNRFIKK